MEHYAGLNVSLTLVTNCIMDDSVRVLWRGDVMNGSSVR